MSSALAPSSLHLIGQAARLSGVSTANIRFYEKEGLLAPGARSANSYRSYSEGDIHRCDGSGPQCRIIEALHERAAQLPREALKARGHRHV